MIDKERKNYLEYSNLFNNNKIDLEKEQEIIKNNVNDDNNSIDKNSISINPATGENSRAAIIPFDISCIKNISTLRIKVPKNIYIDS